MLLKSAAVAAQGSHRGWWDWGVLDAAGNGWNICVVVQQMVNCFASCVRSSHNDDIAVDASPGNAGCCMRERAVPWNECVAVVELGYGLCRHTILCTMWHTKTSLWAMRVCPVAVFQNVDQLEITVNTILSGDKNTPLARADESGGTKWGRKLCEWGYKCTPMYPSGAATLYVHMYTVHVNTFLQLTW